MVLRRYFFVVCFLLTACESGGELAPEREVEPTYPEEVEFLSEDGKTLRGTWQAAPGIEHGPGVLLLHQIDSFEGEGHDRHDWDSVFPALIDSGVSVLAIDFRSHGLSDPADVPLISLGSDREQLRFDVRAGLDFLRLQGGSVRASLRGVAGLGLGASIATVANHYSGAGEPGDWGARALVALSARSERAVDLTDTGDPTLSLTNGLFIAGEDSALDVESASTLYEMTSAERDLLVVEESSAHGAALLDEGSFLVDPIVDWFQLTLIPDD